MARHTIRRQPTERRASRMPRCGSTQDRTKALVFGFGGRQADGDATMEDVLGSRGAKLHEMARLGLPVPPGFTISTKVCTYFGKHQGSFPAGLAVAINGQLTRIEKILTRRFGDAAHPLMLSVRAGARVPIPGMPGTIGNLGLNDHTVQGLVAQSGNPRFAYDCYRRFVQTYGDIVLGLRPGSKTEADPFEVIVERKKRQRGVYLDSELHADDLRELAGEFKAAIRERRGMTFPEDPFEQLWGAIVAMLRSWRHERAVAYRKANDIPDAWGTAVNVEAMVFGNRGDDSGTGVASTRNPDSGEKVLVGEFLMNAQPEDLLTGIRMPLPIADLAPECPTAYRQLTKAGRRLERHYREMMDIEFTIEQGRLYIVHCGVGRRTAKAQLRLAVDFVRDKLIDRPEAIDRVRPDDLEAILAPKLRLTSGTTPIATGLGASAGIASGVAVFDSKRAEALGTTGHQIILIRPELEPEDEAGLFAAQAFVGGSGGAMTSRGAVRCRDMGKPCVIVNTGRDAEGKFFPALGQSVRDGDVITVDGASGAIYWGEIPVARSRPKGDPYLARYVRWLNAVNADDYVKHGVGTLWWKRDIVAGYILPRTAALSPLLSRRGAKYQAGQRRYASFIQPSGALIKEILGALHWQGASDDPDTAAAVWGIMRTLVRLLQRETEIANQHRAMRPLTDPERSLVRDRRAPASHLGAPDLQLIGMEFFGINHFLPNYLDHGCVQWWAVVQCNGRYASEPWRLDTTNPCGESLSPGREQLMAFLVIRDGDRLDRLQTLQFYNELRKREADWDWYRAKDTSWDEVFHALQAIEQGGAVPLSMKRKCRSIGLLTAESTLSPVGWSVIHGQSASIRKHITFQGRTLPHGP